MCRNGRNTGKMVVEEEERTTDEKSATKKGLLQLNTNNAKHPFLIGITIIYFD